MVLRLIYSALAACLALDASAQAPAISPEALLKTFNETCVQTEADFPVVQNALTNLGYVKRDYDTVSALATGSLPPMREAWGREIAGADVIVALSSSGNYVLEKSARDGAPLVRVLPADPNAPLDVFYVGKDLNDPSDPNIGHRVCKVLARIEAPVPSLSAIQSLTINDVPIGAPSLSAALSRQAGGEIRSGVHFEWSDLPRGLLITLNRLENSEAGGYDIELILISLIRKGDAPETYSLTGQAQEQ